MGSVQSYIPVAAALVAAAAYGYVQATKTTAVPHAPSTSTSGSSKKQKQKKKAGEAGASASAKADASVEPTVVPFPPVVPGAFDAPVSPASEPAERATAAAKPKKKKKAKKASTPVPNDAQSDSSATAPESSAARKPKKAAAAKQPPLDDDGWTKVETKKKAGQMADTDAPAGGSAGAPPLEISTSDAGVTTSVTGNSSPVTERTEDESQMADSYVEENRRTLAERLLPKPRKTGVEDLLEQPDYPQLSRVMRIKPKADEQPAAGFSWGDYEDVDDSRGTADDADGEDDGGWGVVKSRGRPKQNKTASQQTPTAQKAPETLTKKQRQHAARREAVKSAKADAEAERLATLAKHKREAERARMAEHAKSSKKVPSGGMTASVDENGKLFWQ